MKNIRIKNDISIVLAGAAGQGIQAIEVILTHVLKSAGYRVFATKEYMSRVRGGINSTELRISSEPISAYLDRIDILIPLDKGSVDHLKKRISKQTLIMGERAIIGNEFSEDVYNIIYIHLSGIAKEIGNIIFSNTIMVGVLTGMFQIEQSIVQEYIRHYFAKKNQDIINQNIEAINLGYQMGLDMLSTGKIQINIQPNTTTKEEIIINGAEAVALGSIAGGCNFLSSYPMTPSTGVLTFLSQQAHEFGMIVEQAEDEISAINMALGASYAGARAMVTTSGGGFALMVEGVSLSGCIEQPIVIHLAQRPGPATGLPTRTEQADLELALYSGHGEFPRMIFAPGSLEEAFYLTQNAFNLADKYQIPVFILTDQYFVDSYYNIKNLDISKIENKKYIIKTKNNYKRYALTKDIISPRGIPNYGEGFVGVDSDEHTEDSRITEDSCIRIDMVDKRLNKYKLMKKDYLKPELIGNKNYKTLLISWGSTFPIVKEALMHLNQKNLALLHFKQIYPLHPITIDYLKQAKQSIIIENNALSQFSRLIKLHTGFEIQHKILKYNGLPFSVEEVIKQITKILK